MLLVNVLLLATRQITNSGAMTCPIHRHISQPVRTPQSWKRTNLSLIEDGQEEIHNGAFAGAPGSNDKELAHSDNCIRLDEHGDDGLVQSTDSSHPQGGASVSRVYDKPDDDHEGEENVE